MESDGSHRYLLLNTFSTDGIRFFRLAADMSKKKSEKKFNPDAIERSMNKIMEISKGRPTEYFGAIVGIDPGMIYAGAAFSLPINSSDAGTQLLISSKSLRGRLHQNQRWLEARKIRDGIISDEAALSTVSSRRAGVEGYRDWIRVWQQDGRLTSLREFYNKPAVAHRRWDTKISQSSQVDRACEFVERLPGSPSPKSSRHEHSRPAKPTLFLCGDATFKTTMKGLAASKHTKLTERLYHRIAKRLPGSMCFSIDEFRTSQYCPRCLQRLEYLRREPRTLWERSKKKVGGDGLVDELRVQWCRR